MTSERVNYLKHWCFISYITTSCTGIYGIMISLETMLTIKEEFAETISFEKILLKKFLFQFKTNATSMMFGYAMFFTPLIACWSLITNRDRIIMFHIILQTIIVMCESVVASNLSPTSRSMQDEFIVKPPQTALLKTIFKNYYNVSLARGLVNEMQEQFHCCGVESYHEYEGTPGIPLSCCDEEDADRCDESTAYSTGCKDRLIPYLLVDFLDTKSYIIIISVQIISIITSLAYMK